jgi:hypothetical protein
MHNDNSAQLRQQLARKGTGLSSSISFFQPDLPQALPSKHNDNSAQLRQQLARKGTELSSSISFFQYDLSQAPPSKHEATKVDRVLSSPQQKSTPAYGSCFVSLQLVTLQQVVRCADMCSICILSLLRKDKRLCNSSASYTGALVSFAG